MVEPCKNPVNRRALTSLSMLFSFLWLPPSGIALHLTESASFQPIRHALMALHVVTNYPLKIRNSKMKVYYDDEVDALYLKLGDEPPEGVIEITEGVNLDTTSEDKIVGCEILKASKRIDLKTILSYTLEVEKDLITQKST